LVNGLVVEEEVTKAATKLIREGDYVAEVRIDLIPDDGAWGPYLTGADAMKLDRVRAALKRGDIEAAAKDAEIYKLTPVAAE
jgi:hypothetical protein